MISSTIVIILFFAVLAGGVHYNVEGVKQSSLTDKQSVNCMRGIAALLIVFSHAHFYVQSLGAMRIFKPFGYIGVSLFFFCSGYGVMHQYMLDKSYLNGFLVKRIKSVYIPYLMATFMYILFVRDTDTEYGHVIKSLFLIDRILPFAWYIPVVLGWYLVFFIVSKTFGDCNISLNVLACLNFLWYVVGYLFGLSSFYYNSTICLTLGCATALYNKDLYRLLSKKISIVFTGIGFISSIGLLGLWGDKNDLIYSVCIFISSTLFIISLFSVGTRIRFNATVPRILGKFSYEIYLTQGIAYSLLHNSLGSKPELFWACLIPVLATTTVGTYFLVCITKKWRPYKAV